MRKPNRRFALCATSIRWSATSLSAVGVACVKSREIFNTYAKFRYKVVLKAVLAADKSGVKGRILLCGGLPCGSLNAAPQRHGFRLPRSYKFLQKLVKRPFVW